MHVKRFCSVLGSQFNTSRLLNYKRPILINLLFKTKRETHTMSVLDVNGKEIILSNGTMPMVGMGCFFAPEANLKDSQVWMEKAIDLGYRGFDVSHILAVEEPISKAIKTKIQAGVVTREDMFITTKLRSDHHHPNDVRKCLEESFKILDLGYIDQYLITWPFCTEKESDPQEPYTNDYIKVWKILEDCVRDGLVKSIGLANFNARQVQEILDNCSIKPTVNQCEVHLYHQNQELAKYCMDRGVAMVGYTPLGNVSPSMSDTWQSPLKDPLVLELAKKYNKTSAQIALRFTVQRGIPVIPSSTNPQRQAENLQIFDFELKDEEMEMLRMLDRKQKIWKFQRMSGHKDYPFHDPY